MSATDHRFVPHDDESSFGGERDAADQGASTWLSSFSLMGKLNLAVFGNTIVLGLVASILLIGTWYLGQMGHAQAVVASVEVRTNNAAIAMVDVVDHLEAARETTDPIVRSAALDQASEELDLAYETLTDPIEFAGERMPANIGPIITGFRDDVDALRRSLDRSRTSEGRLAAISTDAADLYRRMSTFAVEYHTEAAASADRLFSALGNFLLGFVLLVVVGIALSLLGARVIVRSVVASVRSITGTMQRLANGDTDSVIPGRERSDELGDMARSLMVFQSSSLALRDLTDERAREAEDQLNRQREANSEEQAFRSEQSAMLADLALGFEVSVGEVISAVQAASDALRNTSGVMVELAQDSVGQSTEATGAMEAATRNVTAAAAATDEFALSISEISQQAAASAGLARDASQLVGGANAKMSTLNQAAQEIGEIANLIQTIAQRTNLLALNASIEAARGGEAGRGFAVVASEVKELASQTSQATNSVASKIAAMQESTEASASDLASIVEQIERLEQTSTVIASAVDQQSISGEDLARNIDTVAAGSVEVGDRLKALREASHATGNAAGDVLSSAEALGNQADTLQAKASQFIADIRQSSREMALDDNTRAKAS